MNTAGLTIVVPRNPIQTKGLLLASIRSPDPVIFFEPKILYRMSEDMVPVEDYTIPLRKAEVIKEGKDITLVGWGASVRQLQMAAKMVADKGITCEIIDLRTIIPYDIDTIEKSVKKTGRLLITHEGPVTAGAGAEIAAKIQERCFLHLNAPVKRVCGYDTPFPFVYEPVHLCCVILCDSSTCRTGSSSTTRFWSPWTTNFLTNAHSLFTWLMHVSYSRDYLVASVINAQCMIMLHYLNPSVSWLLPMLILY